MRRACLVRFRLSNKILDLPEITRKQLPIGFSVRCARARADAFCSLRARLYPPLWCCALVQDPHDTAGGALSSPNPPRGTRWVTLSASDMYPPLLHTLQFVAIVAPSIAPALLASSTIPPLQFPFTITKRCSVAFLHFRSSGECGLGAVRLLKEDSLMLLFTAAHGPVRVA